MRKIFPFCWIEIYFYKQIGKSNIQEASALSYSIIQTTYSSDNKEISASVFGILTSVIVILVLPFIRKLEVRSIKLELESKGNQAPLV